MIDVASLIERMLWTSIQGTILLLLVWFITSKARNLKPWLRQGLWGVAFAHFFAGLFINIPLPILPPKLVEGVNIFVPVEAMTLDEAIKASNLTAPDTPPSSVPLLLWGVGAFAVLGLTAIRELRFQIRCRQNMLTDGRLQESANRLSKEIGLRRSPKIVLCGRIKTPCISGLFRARICWPADLKLDEPSEQAILAHELVHLKHGDLAMGWIAAITKAVFFFNPFLWLASRELSAQSEIACDREVLHLTGFGRQSYCKLLIGLAATKPFPPATAHAATRDYKLLQRRISRMVAGSPKRRGLANIAVIVATAMALVTAIPLSAVESQIAGGSPSAVDASESVTALDAKDVPTVDLNHVEGVEVVYQQPTGDPILDTVLKLDAPESPASQILKEVEKQAGVKIDPGVIAERKFRLQSNSMTLSALLEVLSSNTGVPWKRVSSREFKFDY